MKRPKQINSTDGFMVTPSYRSERLQVQVLSELWRTHGNKMAALTGAVIEQLGLLLNV